jgi:hypothetical protein
MLTTKGKNTFLRLTTWDIRNTVDRMLAYLLNIMWILIFTFICPLQNIKDLCWYFVILTIYPGNICKCRIINVKDSLNASRQSRAEEVSYTNYFFSKDNLSKNLFPIFAPFIFIPFNMFFHNRVSFLSKRALIKKIGNFFNADGLI